MRFPSSVTYWLGLLCLLVGLGLSPATDKAVGVFTDRCVSTCERKVTNTTKHPDRVAACVQACYRAAGR